MRKKTPKSAPVKALESVPRLRPARMSFRPSRSAETPLPEQLVLTGYRYWFAGYETGDIGCWERAWNELAKQLGPGPAKPVLSELACWVRCQRACTLRKLTVYPHPSRYIAKDECCALSLLGACQRQRRAQARAAAFQLLGATDLQPVIDASTDLAAALSEAELVLTWQCSVPSIVKPDNATKH
jgi:hypothetical protein